MGNEQGNLAGGGGRGSHAATPRSSASASAGGTRASSYVLPSPPSRSVSHDAASDAPGSSPAAAAARKADRPRAHTADEDASVRDCSPTRDAKQHHHHHSPVASKLQQQHDLQRDSQRTTARSSDAGASVLGGGGADDDGMDEASGTGAGTGEDGDSGGSGGGHHFSFSFTLPPQLIQADHDPLAQLQQSQRLSSSNESPQQQQPQRPGQFLSLDFLPTSSPHSSNSSAPSSSLASSSSPSPRLSSCSSSSSASSASSLALGSAHMGNSGSMSSSLSLPPAQALHAHHSSNHASRGSSANSSVSSSPKIAAMLYAHHGHTNNTNSISSGSISSLGATGGGGRHSGNFGLPPRSPKSPSLTSPGATGLLPLSPPRMTRPVSEPLATMITARNNASASSPSPLSTSSPSSANSDVSSSNAGSSSSNLMALSSLSHSHPAPSSASGSTRRLSSSSSANPRRATVETLVVHTRYTPSGQKQINQYVLEGGELGRGSYATVKLAYNTQDQKYYALKIMNKSLLKKRRVQGFSAGMSLNAARTASLGGGGGSSLVSGSNASAMIRAAMDAAAAQAQAKGGVAAPAQESVAPAVNAATPASPTPTATVPAAAPLSHWVNVQREIAIGKKLVHPNVVRLYEVMDDPSTDNLYLVMEHVERGCLMRGEMSELKALPIDQVWSNFRDVLLGLEYLHHNGVIHRDLKPENLLMSASGRVKISDFGVSMLLEAGEDGLQRSVAQGTVGSAAFMAPELLGGGAGIPSLAASSVAAAAATSAAAESSSSAAASAAASSSSVAAASSSGVAVSPCPPSPKVPTPALLAAIAATPFGTDGRSFSMPVGVAPAQGSGHHHASSSPSSSHHPPLPRCHSDSFSSSSILLSSPELSGKKGDVWALGVTLYVLLFGRLPFMARTVALLYKRIVEEEFSLPPGDDPVTNPNNITPETQPELVDLLRRMLDKNPVTRPSVRSLKNHPWVTRGGTEPMEEQCDYEGVPETPAGPISVKGGGVLSPSFPPAAAAQGTNPPSLSLPMPSSGSPSVASLPSPDVRRRALMASRARRSGGGSSSTLTGEALLEEGDERTSAESTDVEADDEGEDIARVDEVGDLLGPPSLSRATPATTASSTASTASDGPSSHSKRPSLSYPRLSITSADVAEAVTLVSKVILVVKLKARMRKARMNLAAQQQLRARSASLGDESAASNSRPLASQILQSVRRGSMGAASSSAAAGASMSKAKAGKLVVATPERGSVLPVARSAADCLSPSLSATTHVSVPVDDLAHAGVASTHPKRRAGPLMSSLLEQARAAISAGTAGEEAAREWSSEHPSAAQEDEHHLGAPSSASSSAPLSPLSPPWGTTASGRRGRSVLFPHRRGTPRASPSTGGGLSSPSSSQPSYRRAMEALALGGKSPLPSSSGGGEVAGRMLSPPSPGEQRSSGSSLGTAMSAPSAQGELLDSCDDDESDAFDGGDSFVSGDGDSGRRLAGSGVNARHQSAPLRPPPALFVPLESFQQHPLSCTNIDDELAARAEAFDAGRREQEEQQERQRFMQQAAEAQQMQQQHSQAPASSPMFPRSQSLVQHTPADASSGSEVDDEEVIEALEPDQDLLDI